MPKIEYKEEVKVKKIETEPITVNEPIPDSFYEIPKEEKKKTTRKKTAMAKPITIKTEDFESLEIKGTYPESDRGEIRFLKDASATLNNGNLIFMNPSMPDLIKKSLCMCLKRVINTCKNGKWDNYMIHAQTIMDFYKITLEDIKNVNQEFNKKIEELGL